MQIIVIVLTLLVSLFQFWWSTAYLYAYSQTRETVLLVQVAQGTLFGMLFISITFFLAMGQNPNPYLSGILLVLGFIMGTIWRKRGGIETLFEYYPRAMIDVLAFRKPKVDLRRRVRGR